MSTAKPDSLFAADKAKWLLENVDKLSEDERALLLAIAEFERDTGREVTPEEQEALDKLVARLAEGGTYVPTEILDAVKRMITAETRHPVDEWPSGIHRLIAKRKKQE